MICMCVERYWVCNYIRLYKLYKIYASEKWQERFSTQEMQARVGIQNQLHAFICKYGFKQGLYFKCLFIDNNRNIELDWYCFSRLKDIFCELSNQKPFPYATARWIAAVHRNANQIQLRLNAGRFRVPHNVNKTSTSRLPYTGLLDLICAAGKKI